MTTKIDKQSEQYACAGSASCTINDDDYKAPEQPKLIQLNKTQNKQANN